MLQPWLQNTGCPRVFLAWLNTECKPVKAATLPSEYRMSAGFSSPTEYKLVRCCNRGIRIGGIYRPDRIRTGNAATAASEYSWVVLFEVFLARPLRALVSPRKNKSRNSFPRQFNCKIVKYFNILHGLSTIFFFL